MGSLPHLAIESTFDSSMSSSMDLQKTQYVASWFTLPCLSTLILNLEPQTVQLHFIRSFSPNAIIPLEIEK